MVKDSKKIDTQIVYRSGCEAPSRIRGPFGGTESLTSLDLSRSLSSMQCVDPCSSEFRSVFRRNGGVPICISKDVEGGKGS